MKFGESGFFTKNFKKYTDLSVRKQGSELSLHGISASRTKSVIGTET
jgi:hypothetical protein